MEAQLRELLDLVARWVHVIAGIMWIGNSLLFNWLDRNLEKPTDEEQRDAKAKGEVLEGRIWLLHSGGFYDVVKKQLAPNGLPAALHWFKWQNFSTWLSGICLLIIVYYSGGAALLVDAQPQRSRSCGSASSRTRSRTCSRGAPRTSTSASF